MFIILQNFLNYFLPTFFRMVEFFQKMKEFVEICNVGDTVTESLTELKKAFCISSALFYKFTK